MFGFGNNKRMDLLADFVPTSKIQLLRFCFIFNEGNVQKAQEMYDYFAKGIDLPDRDPIPPTFFDKLKNGMAFIKDNQDDLMQGYNLIQAMIKGKGIPVAEQAAAEGIPPINE